MQELQKLSEKLDLLLKKYGELQSENDRLKKTITEQLKSIETLNGKVGSLEGRIASVGLGQSVLSVNDKMAVTKEIDAVISEIDKILVSLND